MQPTITLIGNLGKTPESRFTNSQVEILETSIALYTGKDKPAMWVDVAFWDEKGKQYKDKFQKGQRVKISGYPNPVNVWTNKAGETKMTVQISGLTMELCPFEPKDEGDY